MFSSELKHGVLSGIDVGYSGSSRHELWGSFVGDVSDETILEEAKKLSTNPDQVRILDREKIGDVTSVSITDRPILPDMDALLDLNEAPHEFELDGKVWTNSGSGGWVCNLFLERDPHCHIEYSCHDPGGCSAKIRVKFTVTGWTANASHIEWED